MIWRVVNNVNLVINNLILKYVEDDIVLSVNITSAECYTVDEFWDQAFMDISGKSSVELLNNVTYNFLYQILKTALATRWIESR